MSAAHFRWPNTPLLNIVRDIKRCAEANGGVCHVWLHGDTLRVEAHFEARHANDNIGEFRATEPERKIMMRLLAAFVLGLEEML